MNGIANQKGVENYTAALEELSPGVSARQYACGFADANSDRLQAFHGTQHRRAPTDDVVDQDCAASGAWPALHLRIGAVRFRTWADEKQRPLEQSGHVGAQGHAA